MTFGEMAIWKNRLNHTNTLNELKDLAADLRKKYAKYGLFNSVAAHMLHETIMEEMEEMQ